METVNHNEETEIKTSSNHPKQASVHSKEGFGKSSCGCGCGATHKAKPMTEEVVDIEEEWDY